MRGCIQVNPFADGISLRFGCDELCEYLRCTIQCKNAQKISGCRCHSKIEDARDWILYKLRQGENLIAHQFMVVIRNDKLIGQRAFEKFELDNF